MSSSGGQGGSSGASGGAGGGSAQDGSASDSTGSGGAGGFDARAGDGDATASSDAGAGDGDAGARPDAGSSCPTPCSGATPVCDDASGTCKAIQVLAFYTVYAQMADLAHRSFSREANGWFPMVAQANGFTFESTTDWTRLNTVVPAKGRVIMFFDNAPRIDKTQQASFKSYMEKGGAWMGFHVSAYNDITSTLPDGSLEFQFPWYFTEFLGAGKFKNNTWKPTSANLKVEDQAFQVTAGLGSVFKSAPSEWYSWEIDLRTLPNIKVLCSVDPSSFPLGTESTWTSGYYPIVWTNTNYKMVYANFGHNDMDYGPQPDGKTLSFTFSNPTQNKMVFQAIHWLAGVSNNP